MAGCASVKNPTALCKTEVKTGYTEASCVTLAVSERLGGDAAVAGRSGEIPEVMKQ